MTHAAPDSSSGAACGSRRGGLGHDDDLWSSVDEGLVQELRHARREVEQLQVAVDHRTTIGQAQGILMERLGIDADTAFEYLQRVSMHENRKLFVLAVDIVDTVALHSER